MRYVPYLYLLCVWLLIPARAQTPSTSMNYLQSTFFRQSAGKQPVTTIDYFDGLGRPMQSIIYQGMPSRRDIVMSHTTYDAHGRLSQSYLPTPVSTQKGAWVGAVPSTAATFYKDTIPFSQPVYENSPLNQIVASYGPGQDWRKADRANRTLVQICSVNEVRHWQAPFDQPGKAMSEGFYPAGGLYKRVSINQDNYQTIEYTNQNGQLLQRNVQDSTTLQGAPVWMITCYVYNEMERLAYVIPPALYKATIEGKPGTITLSEQADIELLYAYHYDYKGRVIERLAPGQGWTYTVYSPTDAPVLTQDEVQRKENKWTFLKYDAFDRVVLEGIITRAATREQLADSVQSAPAYDETRDENDPVAKPLWGYSNRAYPYVSSEDVMQINYYGDYEWDTNGMGFVAFDSLQQFSTPHTLLTGSKARLLNGADTTFLTSVIYYDQKGSPVQTHQQNPFGGTTRTDLSLNFAGELLRKRTTYHYTDGKPDYITLAEYEYDHTGRIRKAFHAVQTPADTTPKGILLAE